MQRSKTAFRTTTFFGEWLTGVVEAHSLEVVAPPDEPDRRMGTWSERLSIAMGKDDQYDSSLRRIANGANTPRAEKTYQIGCGLRACGLMWCSGTLALMRNPKTFEDLLAVMDIASSHLETRAGCVEWLRRADELAMTDPRAGSPKDEKVAVGMRASLAHITDEINANLDSAFTEYQKHGLRSAHGLLGNAYQLATDKHSGPDAMTAVYGLIKIWLGIKFEPHELDFPAMFDRHLHFEHNRIVVKAPVTLKRV